MQDPLPRLYTYTKALVTAALGAEDANDKLHKAKYDALNKSLSALERYGEEYCFPDAVLDTIMEKKAAMILEATSKKEIAEIMSPPKPRYDGKRWHTSPYSVPEEEMLAWSLASTRVRLQNHAVERYAALLRDYLGADIFEAIWR